MLLQIKQSYKRLRSTPAGGRPGSETGMLPRLKASVRIPRFLHLDWNYTGKIRPLKSLTTMQAEILAGGSAKQPMFEASQRLGEFGLRIFWYFWNQVGAKRKSLSAGPKVQEKI
jgi:hypothetical protein